ncbi:hypothetical protein LVB87_07120 [Lysobacter sp. KIS68-7]|uniref:hypothetical protein n=1 Tax=Lysobacter sp. KIS68-7 TaxID=2904252 RepID=UPI001E30DC8B|nr:hypothetical protein [Lysobacter sp. KIS68-7]UHQ20899.1 hypothetical protein LVB87_07120 [Lysobacter sp. KIS68-7]
MPQITEEAKETRRFILRTNIWGCSALMAVAAFVPIYVLIHHGFAYGDIHDRAGHVIVRVRQIYAALAFCLFMFAIGGLLISWSLWTLRKDREAADQGVVER